MVTCTWQRNVAQVSTANLEHAVIKKLKLSTVRNTFKYAGKNYRKKVTIRTTSMNTFTAVSNVPNFMDLHGPSIQRILMMEVTCN